MIDELKKLKNKGGTQIPIYIYVHIYTVKLMYTPPKNVYLHSSLLTVIFVQNI